MIISTKYTFFVGLFPKSIGTFTRFNFQIKLSHENRIDFRYTFLPGRKGF